MGNKKSSQRSVQQKNCSNPSKCLRIEDNYTSLEQVYQALQQNGLESSNLILGIDFTKSNEWNGKNTYDRKCLHNINPSTPENPYVNAIKIIGRTLRLLDDDNKIPVYGFGDQRTNDHSIFKFSDDYCLGIEDVLRHYHHIVPAVSMAGPTCFAPIINQAISIVEYTGGYHILVIIADGQVTRSVDIPDGHFSPQENQTVEAIVQAIGVGDGPWDMMKHFDDHLPQRKFDNFQFVNYSAIKQSVTGDSGDTVFALHAMMEIPEQYATIKRLGYLNRSCIKSRPQIQSRCLSPPVIFKNSPEQESGMTCDKCTFLNPVGSRNCSMCFADMGKAINTKNRNSPQEPLRTISSSSQQIELSHTETQSTQIHHLAQELENLREQQFCMICLNRPNDLVFGCGHQTCETCGSTLVECPVCRQTITTRIKMFHI